MIYPDRLRINVRKRTQKSGRLWALQERLREPNQNVPVDHPDFDPGAKRASFAPFILKLIHLPRQARDKETEI
jgi:hypothetical protein